MPQPTLKTHAEALSAAQAEIAKPALATTKQILAVHEIETLDGAPRMVWMSAPMDDESVIRVHFSVRGEPYKFGVSVKNVQPMRAVASYLEASTSISLGIKSDSLAPDEISRRTGLAPSHTQKKNEPVTAGASAPTNSWTLEGTNKSAPADVAIPEFIEQLESAAAQLLAISALADTDVYVAVTYHGNVDWMWGLHFEASSMRRLAAIGAAFDLSLYASGPALPSD